MTTRDTFNGDSTDVAWEDSGGEGLGNQYARHVGNLYGVAAMALGDVAGADTVTASVDPVLPAGGLAAHMLFQVTWAAANTGGVTLNIDGTGAVPVLTSAGDALTAGALTGGLVSLLKYDGSDFRILGGSSASTGKSITRQVFTVSGTWTKPAGYSDDARVAVRAWAGGGGGGDNSGASDPGGGGGGGEFVEWVFRYGDLPSTVAVAIGAGGAAGSGGHGSDGGDTSFGTLLAAKGGQGGRGNMSSASGGAGGSSGAGSFAGGNGREGGVAGQASARGGGGGGGGASGSAPAGGASLFGGNGGAGGNSGTAALAGAAPGGGGGGAGGSLSGIPAPGARGELIIEIYE